MFSSEAEPHGSLYAPVAGGGVAAAEAARRGERLPEEGRAEVADRVGEVRVVEHVDEEEREGQRVALLLAAAAAQTDHHRAAHPAAHHLRRGTSGTSASTASGCAAVATAAAIIAPFVA